MRERVLVHERTNRHGRLAASAHFIYMCPWWVSTW